MSLHKWSKADMPPKTRKSFNFNFRFNNLRESILVAVFLSLLIVPGIAYNFFNWNLGELTENRTLKEKPLLKVNNLTTYPMKYEAYYNDHLPFKNLWIKFNSMLKYKVFDTSPARYVIIGSGGWLFYNSKYKSDADTIGDYQHTNKYTKEQLELRRKNLVNRQNFLKEQGIEMYLFIPPNKSQVYSEYMPDRFSKHPGSSRVEELINYLKENTSITVVNPMEQLQNYKSKYLLYYKLDTHWNRLGAYIGYVELMKAIKDGPYYSSLDELKIKSKPKESGDLVNMINLKGELQDYEFDIEDFKNDIKVSLVEEKSYTIKKYKSTNLNGKKLLCFRDSFFNAVIPYISKDFEESVYLWDIPYSEEIIKKEKPDVVIFESVERLANFGR